MLFIGVISYAFWRSKLQMEGRSGYTEGPNRRPDEKLREHPWFLGKLNMLNRGYYFMITLCNIPLYTNLRPVSQNFRPAAPVHAPSTATVLPWVWRHRGICALAALRALWETCPSNCVVKTNWVLRSSSKQTVLCVLITYITQLYCIKAVEVYRQKYIVYSGIAWTVLDNMEVKPEDWRQFDETVTCTGETLERGVRIYGVRVKAIF